MDSLFSLLLLPVLAVFFGIVAAVDPQAIYNGGFHSTTSPILLRIGNGGAGQSGLIKGKVLQYLQLDFSNFICSPCGRFYSR